MIAALLIVAILIVALLGIGLNMSYIPRKQADLALWAENFASVIEADPTAYGLTAADATAIRAAVDAFDAALQTATDPSTRTPTAVAAKDAARAAMIEMLRQYSQQIQANDGVSNEEKGELGLTIRDTTPTPIPAPDTSPVIDVVHAGPLSHRLRFHDSNTQLRAKPYGVVALELKIAYGPVQAMVPGQAQETMFVTRFPKSLNFEPTSAGQVATYFARYVTARGLTGPWSAAAAMTIPFSNQIAPPPNGNGNGNGA